MYIGILGGTFDPPHLGHTYLAKYFLEHTDLDEIWLMVSPENPLKQGQYKSPQKERFEMTQLSTADIVGLRASDFEFNLASPSYTIQTLNALTEHYPQHQFALIIGADNMQVFDQWDSYQELLDKYRVYVYPRNNIEDCAIAHQHIQWVQAPEYPLSSSLIREKAYLQEDINNYLDEKVKKYIFMKKLYEK